MGTKMIQTNTQLFSFISSNFLVSAFFLFKRVFVKA